MRTAQSVARQQAPGGWVPRTLRRILIAVTAAGGKDGLNAHQTLDHLDLAIYNWNLKRSLSLVVSFQDSNHLGINGVFPFRISEIENYSFRIFQQIPFPLRMQCIAPQQCTIETSRKQPISKASGNGKQIDVFEEDSERPLVSCARDEASSRAEAHSGYSQWIRVGPASVREMKLPSVDEYRPLLFLTIVVFHWCKKGLPGILK
ncbi:hypothetical protein EV359DRAFT_61217 [Lentinula novae-zelandiae]|nr:hypothetical protein EV359DRAFT_61217 [Lentinula novae-zelandiae]